MSLQYIDRLEEQLPDVVADDSIRAMVFTGEELDHFSAGMNLKQLPENETCWWTHRVFRAAAQGPDMIENGSTPAIATLFGYCLGETSCRWPAISGLLPKRGLRSGCRRWTWQRACMGWFGSTSWAVGEPTRSI